MSIPSNVDNRMPTAAPSQSIYEESSTQLAKLGSEIRVGDRCFRYAAAGANLAAGDIVATPAATYSAKQTVSAAAAIGTTQVSVYITATVGANALAEGYFTAQDSAGQGYMYKIRSHPAIGDTSTGTLTLYDPIQVALTATSKHTVTPNKYSAVTNLIGATTPIVGVSQAVVTSGNYFWAQVEGPAAVKVNTTVAYGSILVPATTGGATLLDVTANDESIGISLSAATTADTAIVSLSIANK